MLRRSFVKSAVALGLLSTNALARNPIERKGPARFSYSLAAYSLRKYFRFFKGKPQTPADDGQAIDMVGFLDYCVAHDFDAAELTSYFFPAEPDANYFRNLRREAFVRGVTISGTAIGNDFTVKPGEPLKREIKSAIDWIDKAAELGAPHIRFFAGTGAQLSRHPERMASAVEAIGECAAHAAKRGIVLGIENHGNLTSDQMLEIMKLVKSRWVGVNLDTGNFVSDDPYRDLERTAPYAVNVQVKVAMCRPDKTTYPADMKRVGSILRKSGFQGFVALEFEEAQPYAHIPDAFKKMRQSFEG